ncbi:MAG: T9SS type A sorting domain-containing protein, partial [Bacteroidota bacterium]
PIAGSNGNVTICAGSTVTLTQLNTAIGTHDAGGIWTPTLAGAGIYTYTVAATTPCTVPATATVTVTEQAQPIAGSNGNVTICAGSTVTLVQLNAAIGTHDAGGIWTPTLAGAGIYTYTVAATAPCTVPATATVTVTEHAQPIAGSNGSVTICAGSTVTLAQLNTAIGTHDAGGIWTPTLAGAGTYTYTVAATAPCTVPATATVTVTEQAPATPIVSVVNNCGSSTLTITNAIAGASFTWTGGLISNPGTATTQGTYYVTQTDVNGSGCTSAQSAGAVATPNSYPTAPSVTVVDPICGDNNGYITITSATTGLQFNLNGLGYAAYTGPYTVNASTGYSILAKTAAGCISISATTGTIGAAKASVGTLTVNVTNPICGDNNGYVTITSATTGLQFNMNGSGYAAFASPYMLAPNAAYSIIAKNNDGCTSNVVSGTIGAAKITPLAPTGSASQAFCTGTSPLVSNLIVTGTSIVWYNAATLGTVVPTTTALVNGAIYYASQNNGTCESSARLAVTANVTTSNAQTLAITSSAGYWNSVSSGTSVIFTATNTGTVAPSDIQWFKNNVNTTMTGTTYTYTPVEGDFIKAVVNPSTCSSGATSNVITMHIFVTNTWTGTTSNAWNVATNWSLGIVPLSYHNVIVPAVTNMPTISTAGLCHDFTLLNNATFIDNNKYLSILGALEADRSLTPGKWHFIASPVLLAYGYAFSGDNPDNGTGVNKDTLYLYKYNESTNVFAPIAVGNQEILTPGKGYEVWSTKQVTIKLKGVYGNQLQSLNDTLSLTCTAPYASHGYNLVGNPFPCALDLTNSGTWEQANMSAAIMTWDPVAKNYKYKIGTGITTLPGNLIPAYQAFYVVATGASPKMIIPTSAKTHGGTFYKSSIADLLHLTVNGNNYMDETFINFNSNATEGFDGQYDVEKLFGADEVPQFYSLLSDKNLAVNTLPDITSNPVVQMGFSVTVAGTYSITASELSSFVAGTSIKLEDTKLNTFTDLNAQPVYSFSADANDNVNRFKVHFGAPNGINNNNGNGGINIYSDNNIIYINNLGTEQIKDIVVYDLLGQELLRKQASNNTVNTVNMQFATAYYMVKVVTSSNVYTKKIYVK